MFATQNVYVPVLSVLSLPVCASVDNLSGTAGTFRKRKEATVSKLFLQPRQAYDTWGNQLKNFPKHRNVSTGR